jgi:hypothetical protein
MEAKILEALRAAQERGVRVIRGPVFDWCGSDAITPTACNAFGALLLHIGKEQMVGPDLRFQPGWFEELQRYLGVNDFWLWRFNQGFNGGYQLTLTQIDKEKKKESVLKDKVSALGLTIRKKFGLGSRG